MVSTTLVVLLSLLSNSNAVTTLNLNHDDDICPGEQLMLTCCGQGTSQRWAVMTEGGLALVEHTFTRSDWQTQVNKAEYNFTLVSTAYENFESTLSTISSSTLRNAQVECVTSDSSSNRITLKIRDVPSPPQILNITEVEYDGRYSIISVTWKRPMSYIDYYQLCILQFCVHQYHNASASDPSALITVVPNVIDRNVTLSLSAHNCAGERSTTLANISISGLREDHNIISATYFMNTYSVDTPTSSRDVKGPGPKEWTVDHIHVLYYTLIGVALIGILSTLLAIIVLQSRKIWRYRSQDSNTEQININVTESVHTVIVNHISNTELPRDHLYQTVSNNNLMTDQDFATVEEIDTVSDRSIQVNSSELTYQSNPIEGANPSIGLHYTYSANSPHMNDICYTHDSEQDAYSYPKELLT